jgi:hypothetical protein
MRKLLITCAAMIGMVTSAHALGGIDLSVNACPGNAGAVGDVMPIDCASGLGFTVLGTWAPVEDLPGLTNLDGIMEIYAQEDLDGTGAFWNFDEHGCNSLALHSSEGRPASGCSSPVDYTDAWASEAGGTAIAAGRVSPHIVRIGFTCYRTSLLSVQADQKLFGIQLIVYGGNAAEAGGSCQGCSSPASIVWNQAEPGDTSVLASQLTGGTGHYPGFGNCMAINNGPGLCGVVPTRKRTWGQLKSLYR